MTAGIFARHGVWVGNCLKADHRNPRGYFENIAFRNALRSHAGSPAGTCENVPGWPEKARALLAEEGYEGGPWLVKYSAFYWPLWRQMDAHLVVTMRDPDAIWKSGQASGYIPSRTVLKAYGKAVIEAIDAGAAPVDTSAVAAGNHATLAHAFERCGLDLDPAIVDDFVDPNLWHY